MAISKSTVETWDEDRLRWIKMHRKNDKINHTEKKEEENTLWRARIEVTLMEGALSHRLGSEIRNSMHLRTEKRNWRESKAREQSLAQMHVPTSHTSFTYRFPYLCMYIHENHVHESTYSSSYVNIVL